MSLFKGFSLGKSCGSTLPYHLFKTCPVARHRYSLPHEPIKGRDCGYEVKNIILDILLEEFYLADQQDGIQGIY